MNNNKKNHLSRQIIIIIQYNMVEKIYMARCVCDVIKSGRWKLRHSFVACTNTTNCEPIIYCATSRASVDASNYA